MKTSFYLNKDLTIRIRTKYGVTYSIKKMYEQMIKQIRKIFLKNEEFTMECGYLFVITLLFMKMKALIS